MHRALGLLLWLRLIGWFRRYRRSLRTAKGILLSLFGALLLLSWILTLALAPRSPSEVNAISQVDRYGPLALLVFCLLNVIFSSGESTLTFSPAEVHFLFPGPFSRRQLLAYKLITSFLLAQLMVLFLCLALRNNTPLLSAYVGLLLIVLFMQYFSQVLGLIGSTVGLRAFTRGRQVVLVLIGIAAIGILVQLGSDWLRLPANQVLERLQNSPVLSLLLTPFRWFTLAYSAPRIWPDLVVYGSLGLAVNAALVALIFALDAHFLESSAAVSERLYAKVERMRSGGPAALGFGSGKARFRLPMLPWWGGAGPIAWRQLTTVLRSRGAVIFVLVLGISFTGPLLAAYSSRNSTGPGEVFPALFVALFPFFLTGLVAYDFRSDLDRLDVLKSLPVSSLALAGGQVLAPVVLVCLVQWLTLAVLTLVNGRFSAVYLATAIVVVPYNFLLFGLENLMFLLFPTRLVATGPADFQVIGRNLLQYLLKMTLLSLALGAALSLAVPVWWLSGKNLAAGLAAAGPVLAGLAVGIVPLVAWAFRRFDVTRDTPP